MAQIETRDFFPPFGQLGGPGEEPWPLAAGADPLDLGAHRGKDLLLIAMPTDPNGVINLGLYGPFGEMDYPEGGEWQWRGTQATLYVAATDGRATANDDVPAATAVPGMLAPTLNYGQQLFDGADPTRLSSPGAGEIALTDPKGRLDYLLDYVWDGAPIILKRGVRGTPYSAWETVGRFNGSAIVGDIDAKRIALRDLGWQLGGPLHDQYYGGTGGLDGDASTVGRWKPLAMGYVFNAEPALISGAGQIFQGSFASSQAILDLRHGGVSLDFFADYPTFEALRDAPIPSGNWGSCLAQTLVRPNVTLQYGIRIDFIGDSTVAYGHPAPTTRSAIARRIATTYGPNRLDNNTQIDVPSFAAVESRHPALCGWHWSTPISKADALNEVLGGILGYWKVKSDGTLSIGYVDTPSRGSIINLPYKANGMGKPAIIATAPPRAGTAMAWRRNYGPQQNSELAPSIAANGVAAALYGQPASYVQSLSPHVARLYPTAALVAMPGNFWLEVDAAVEANRQQGLLEVERKRWQWEMRVDPFLDLTGSGATLTDFDRLRTGHALPLLCVGMDTPGTEATTFDFWG